MASASLAAALALAGCQTEGPTTSTRSLKPLSREMLASLEQKNMPKESPILVRIFKQEAELEVWKQDATGRYALLRTYPICRWSGELGPKVREGDRQAPEGFYTITPTQMNPNSQYYLSFNLGYPNAFDQAHGRTGAHLMVHGDCSSRGCYAMTDDQIAEIYALGRESFFGGQRAFQVQAYPFRMTAANFAKHRNNPNVPFWKMLKEGNDQFELTGMEPKVDVCEKRYVFNAQPPANATPITRPLSSGPFGQSTQASAALKFNPTGRCPAYQIDPEVAAALKEKRQRDETQIAELVRRGTPAAPVRTGVDGGMHASFLAKLKPREIKDADGSTRMVVDTSDGKPLGTYVNPPRAAPETAVAGAAKPETTASVPSAPAGANRAGSAYQTASASSRPAPAPSRSSGNMFTRLFTSDSQEPTAAPPQPQPAAISSTTARSTPQLSRPQPAAVPAAPVQQQARPAVALAPHGEAVRPAADTQAPATMNGAQPPVPSGSFESRWGAFR